MDRFAGTGSLVRLILRRDRWILLAAEHMQWMGNGAREGAFGLLLDRQTGVAVLNGEGFAQPMLCE